VCTDTHASTHTHTHINWCCNIVVCTNAHTTRTTVSGHPLISNASMQSASAACPLCDTRGRPSHQQNLSIHLSCMDRYLHKGCQPCCARTVRPKCVARESKNMGCRWCMCEQGGNAPRVVLRARSLHALNLFVCETGGGDRCAIAGAARPCTRPQRGHCAHNQRAIDMGCCAERSRQDP
jgi:hypothetical protein